LAILRRFLQRTYFFECNAKAWSDVISLRFSPLSIVPVIGGIGN
jgi:hypothetical protein